jgi:SAM-dependent methyltransferase
VDPKRIVRDGYDQIYRRFDAWSSGADEVRPWFLHEILERLPPGSDILELGCGGGADAAALAEGRSYVGVDLSTGQLSLARQRLPDLRFILGDLTGVSFPDGTFDAVVAFFVFNHVPRADQGPAFARIFGWLRPGGRFMGSLGVGGTDDEIQEDWLGAPMFFASFDRDTNERLLREAGFELELSETRIQIEEGEGEATFHWVIARKPEVAG